MEHAHIPFEGVAKDEIAEGAEKGAIPVESTVVSHDFDAVCQQDLAVVPCQLLIEEPAGSSEETECCCVRSFFGVVQNGVDGLGHFEGNLKTGSEPQNFLFVQLIGALGQHALPLALIDNLDNLNALSREMHAITRFQLADDGMGQIGYRVSSQFQLVVFFGFGEVAPYAPVQESISVPPSAMEQAGMLRCRGRFVCQRRLEAVPMDGRFPSQPSQFLHGFKKHLQGLVTFREKIAQGRQGKTLLFVEA